MWGRVNECSIGECDLLHEALPSGSQSGRDSLD